LILECDKQALTTSAEGLVSLRDVVFQRDQDD
jgi:hypothetical protein